MVSDSQHGELFRKLLGIEDPLYRVVDSAYALRQRAIVNYFEVESFVVWFSKDLYNPSSEPARMWGLPVRCEIDTALPHDTMKVGAVIH